MRAHQPSHFTNAEIESIREQHLNGHLDNDKVLRATVGQTFGDPLTEETLVERCKPGTLSCHEAFTLAGFLEKQVNALIDHPAVVANPAFFRLAHQAGTALFNLHQDIADKHLDAIGPVMDRGNREV